jgi:hypothetical protein
VTGEVREGGRASLQVTPVTCRRHLVTASMRGVSVVALLDKGEPVTFVVGPR